MIYLDNAATTRLDDGCWETLKKYNSQEFYNPSALYRKAIESSKSVKNARGVIAKSLGAKCEDSFPKSGHPSAHYF